MQRNTNKRESKVSDMEAEKQYLIEANQWDQTNTSILLASNRRAWIVAGVATVMALISVTGISVLGPQKTTEPFVIRVDKTTGSVDIVAAMKDAKETYEEVVSKYFVAKYVNAREGYMWERAIDDHDTVVLMSKPSVASSYHEQFDKSNPSSPLNIYNNFAKVDVKIKSISFLNNKTALVRYSKSVIRSGEKPDLTHWQATLPFAYSKAPSKESDRLKNPLGFQATDWRTDPDSVESLNIGVTAR